MSAKRRKATPAAHIGRKRRRAARVSVAPPVSEIRVASAERGSPVRTIIYIHGIGNKPEPNVLKCQWDRALFNMNMGDRTRIAYWVDQERYPVMLQETCSDSDVIKGAEVGSMSGKMALAMADESLDLEQVVGSITSNRQDAKTLQAIGRRNADQ